MLQTIVENAVKHGLSHKKSDRVLKLDFQTEDHTLNIIVEDNGIGREASAKINAANKLKPRSFATNALQKRIANINDSNELKFHIKSWVEDLNEPTGTKVIFTIKYY